MMTPGPIIAGAIAYAIYIGYLIFVCREAWLDFRRVVPYESFRFSITDTWAAILGLTPSILLAAAFFGDRGKPLYLVALMLLFPAQVTWIFKGRLMAEQSELSSVEETRGGSEIVIFTYAMLAIAATAVYVLAFWMCLPALILYVVLYFRREARQKV